MRRVLSVLVVSAVIGLMLPAVTPAATWTFEHDANVAWVGSNPQGVAVDKFGTMYVVGESRDFVDVYNAAGVYQTSWGGSGAGDGLLSGPRDVAVDRWGNVYVAEKYNPRVTVYNGIGLFSRHISQPGGDPEDLSNPNGIAVSDEGMVYVSDNTEDIRKFDRYGAFQGKWTTDGAAMGICADQDGDVWVVNTSAYPGRPLNGNTVMRYSRYGVLLDSWGSTGTANGQFDAPYDVDVDGGGRVFVVEAGGDRGQVFENDGTFIETVSSGGVGTEQLNGPYGVATGFSRNLEISDNGNDRISRWSPTPEIETDSRGVSGTNRYATAVAASQVGYPDGSGSVVIATGLNWPDALGGASLAGVHQAPLLLTAPDALSPETAAEIARLGAAEAYILGGPGAVSAAVFDAVDAIVADVWRFGGSDRYETAALIADETISQLGSTYAGAAFVVTGDNFPDALAAAPISAANRWPIYLTRADALGSTKAAMQGDGVTHGYIIGGTGVVGTAVEDDLNATFVGFSRYGGSNRYETAASVATVGFTGMGMYWARPALATGEDFPDALAGGVLQGSDYSVMLLTPSGSLHPSARAALDTYQDSIYELRFLGGTGAVSQTVRDAAMARLH